MRAYLKPLVTMFALCIIVLIFKAPLRVYLSDPLAIEHESYVYKLPPDAKVQKTRVIDVSDGDTITIQGGQRVRFLNIDTPELSHPAQNIREECYGREATARLSQLVANRDVILVSDSKDTDKYKRLLRYVFVPLEGRPGEYLNTNAYMVGEGYARDFVLESDNRYKDDFVELEKLARDAKKGLWASCDREKFRW